MDLYSSFWETEFADLELPDFRLNSRLTSLLSSMCNSPGSGFNQISSEKKVAKAAYRLIDNANLDVDEILQAHFEKLVERVSNMDCVYLIEDTTGFNYNHSGVKGLGRIGGKLGRNKTESKGLFAHTTLALSSTGEPMGIFDQKVWARDTAPRKDKSKLPVQDRASFKWIKALDREEFFEDRKIKFIVLADREADIKMFQGFLLDKSMDFVIRSRDSRVDQRTGKSLDHFFEDLTEKQLIELNIGQRTVEQESKRKPQVVRYNKADQKTLFEVKYSEVQIKVESIEGSPRLERLNAVYVNEVKTKPGKNRISWLLLTSLPVDSYEAALQVVDHYKVRWRIEVFHKAQKSVCQLEHAKFRTAERLKRYIFLQSLVAFAVFRLKYLLVSAPDEPARSYIDEGLIKILKMQSKQYKPKGTVTIKDFIFMLANIEGYKTFKLETPPGVIVLGEAIKSFNLILRGYDMARK